MMQYLWFLLALCGLGMMIYGLFLFFAMPATGVFVIVAGLMFFNIAFKGRQRNEKRSEGETVRGERTKGKRVKSSDPGGSEAAINSTRAPVSRGFKIAASILFFTNMLLISSIIPHFSGFLGNDLGYVVRLVLTFVVTLFYTGLNFSFFKTGRSIALVASLTWAVIIMRAVR